MTTSKAYDYLNRLQSIASVPSSSSSLPLGYAYQYNAANQRTRVTLNDGSFWIYLYDALGQVKSGKKYFNDNTPVSGQQFEYGFDDIGNRSSTKAGGDATGSSASLRSASYTANSLNQYSSRTVPNAFDVLGIATASSSVTVNGSSADYRRNEYFQELVGVNNSSTSVWQSVTVTTSSATNAGNVFVPSATESFGYDADGNQTNDGRWSFTWDAENRLVSMQAISSVPSGAKKKLDFAYDYFGRRIQKIVSTLSGTNYVAQSTNRFLYDGWNLVAELNSTNGIIRTYLWGQDLSGTMKGAGGVGGLLAIRQSSGAVQFAAYDGNGNVTGLYDPSVPGFVGLYEYGPFGETIRLTPNSNNQSPFRFSTKYMDDESDMVYYGFRYYSPTTGRWLSRDPNGESGGRNLYRFVNNNPIVNIDKLGLFPFCNKCKKLNEVRVIKEDWEIGTPEKTPGQLEALKDALHAVHQLENAVNILELAEGKPSILFPKPDISDQGIVFDLLAFQPVNLFGRIKYKVCLNIGPRFFFFGSDQLDWVEYTKGWEASDKNSYGSGGAALEDVPRFMDQMLVSIKNEYPD